MQSFSAEPISELDIILMQKTIQSGKDVRWQCALSVDFLKNIYQKRLSTYGSIKDALKSELMEIH